MSKYKRKQGRRIFLQEQRHDNAVRKYAVMICLLVPMNGWIFKRWSRELVICFFSGTDTISIFYSFVEEQRQTSHITVVSMVVETISLARLEVPLSSSSRMRKISGASFWVLKLKEASIDVDIFCCSAHKKLDGSTAYVEHFNKDMLRATDVTKASCEKTQIK